MPETRIKSHVVSSFTQPSLEGTVAVIMHTDIDWLRVGVHVYVPEGGVYEVTNITANVYTMKLKTQEQTPGNVVVANIMYPINYDAANEYSWGAKEW